MSSTSETGHAKNVATFEDLISFCTGYGATYNPSKASLKTAALTIQLTAANTALQNVRTTKTTYDNATNAREIAFKPLKPLATKVVNSLTATDATEQTLKDAKSSKNKMQGKKAKTAEKSTASATTDATASTKTVSTSQQSYDKLIDHFAQLIATLTAEPKYVPNEADLKLTALNALLTDLKAKNTAVINAITAVSNARITRDQALYAKDTGILDTAKDVKAYVKSIFSATSPQYKQVSGLKFTKRSSK